MNEGGEILRHPTSKENDEKNHDHSQIINQRNSAGTKVPLNRIVKFTIFVSFLQFLTISALESIVFVQSHQNTARLEPHKNSLPDTTIPNAKALSLYHSIFIAAQLFQFIFTYDAVIHSSFMQTIASVLFNTALFGYSLIQYRQASILFASEREKISQLIPSFTFHPTATLELIIAGLMLFFLLIFFSLAVKLYRIFGWHIFKELGADASLRKKFQLYHLYFLLLKLDVFFFIGFSVQYLVLVLGEGDTTRIIIHAAIALPCTLLLLLLGFVSLWKENKILLSLFLVGSSAGMGYLTYKLVDILTTTDTNKYKSSKNSLTFFNLTTLCLCCMTFVIAILNLRNFGDGLMNKFRESSQLRKSKEQNLLSSL